MRMHGRPRDLALFDLGVDSSVDSKLSACDLVSLRIRDVCHGDAGYLGIEVDDTLRLRNRRRLEHRAAPLLLSTTNLRYVFAPEWSLRPHPRQRR